MRKERVVLEYGVHVPPVGRQHGDVLTGDTHSAVVGIFETADHAQDRGLARTRRPEDRDEGPLGNPEGDVVHGLEGAVELAYPLEFNVGCH